MQEHLTEMQKKTGEIVRKLRIMGAEVSKIGNIIRDRARRIGIRTPKRAGSKIYIKHFFRPIAGFSRGGKGEGQLKQDYASQGRICLWAAVCPAYFLGTSESMAFSRSRFTMKAPHS